MSLPTESVTSAGSGLVFINYYDSNVTDAYRNAIISAENILQSHFTDQLTVNVTFGYSALTAGYLAQNNFSQVNVSYARLVNALSAHAVTADDKLAVAGLPATDPSNGVGFAVPIAQAVVLGLAAQSNIDNDRVVLNSNITFGFGQDAIGAIEHELTEGVFGRTASLGFSGRWEPLDLFRFTATGVRDYTGGSDGLTTFFGIDAGHVTNLQFHRSISASGVNDGFDLGDWDHTFADAFGPGGPSNPGSISATDLRVLDVLGWTPTSAGKLFIPAADEYASSLTDGAAPFGQINVGSAITGALQQAGDHDWFKVTLQAGATYTILESGHSGGGGTLGDPYMQLRDASGNVLASNDDIVAGSSPDSQIVFTPTTTGTYFIDAGAFADGYAGTYRLSLNQTGGAPASTGTGQVLNGAAGGDTIQGGTGDDTITGGQNGANYLRGNDGNDVINGGSAFDDINGNQGADTAHGNGGDDWVVGGKGDDVLFGDAGDDIVWGNLGNDTLDGGSGNDQVRGGQGDDSLSGGAGNDYISGDRGADTESGGAGADIFHSFSGAGVDRVIDFNAAEGDRVMLDPGTTYTASQVGGDTVVDMGNGDQVILVGVQMSTLPTGWIFLG